MCVCVCVCKYIYTYTYIYIHIHTYTYTLLSSAEDGSKKPKHVTESCIFTKHYKEFVRLYFIPLFN